MDAYFTYLQQDSTIQALQQPEDGKQLSGIKQDSVIDISKQKKESTSTQFPPEKTKKKYTAQQIRYWRKRQENKLLVNGSRYIMPRSWNNLELNCSVDTNLILPIREKPQFGTDWLTLLLFFIVAILATVWYPYMKYIKRLFVALVNYPTSVRLLLENNNAGSFPVHRFNLIFYLTASVFIYQIFNFFNLSNASEEAFYWGNIFVFSVLFLLGKNLLYRAIAWLFETKEETNEYLFNVNSFYSILGIILLPLVALIAFAPFYNPFFLLLTGIIIVLIFYFLLLKRGALILLRKQFSIFYLFLYLCTLELLPLFMLYKVIAK